ncbi:MAG: hypothetical protein K2R98_07385 [Gemmataceae bacterium]|nr:hypothetical protein [Gemmataceae bacterium]
MRKTSSKELKKPNKQVARAAPARKLNGSTKAKNGSTTTSAASGTAKTPRTNSAKRPGSDAHRNELLDRAFARKNCDDHEGALRAFADVLAEYPDYAPALGMMGSIYLSMLGKPAEAIPLFQRTTALVPKSELASLGLFHSLWETGHEAEALKELKRFQSISHSRDYDEILAEWTEEQNSTP